jgi:hypothetical protein
MMVFRSTYVPSSSSPSPPTYNIGLFIFFKSLLIDSADPMEIAANVIFEFTTLLRRMEG